MAAGRSSSRRCETRWAQETHEAFLRDYAETFKWEIATPEDLKALAEEYCGCDLTALFEEWVY